MITGETGFIGRRLLYILRRNNFKVVTLGRSTSNRLDHFMCDLENEVIPKNTCRGVSTVFHLAGVAHDVSASKTAIERYKKLNVNATLSLAENACQNGVKCFVYVSSVKASGKLNYGRCASEEMQGEFNGMYGKSKREAEIRLLDFAKTSQMKVKIIRPALVYGPNVKGNLQSMQKWITKGLFPPIPETGNKRSMIHVDDLARAMIMIADHEDTSGKIFNATDGNTYSTREIFNQLCLASEKKIPKWSIPKFLLEVAKFSGPLMKDRIEKLMGSECYSSKRLEQLGFVPMFSLKDIGRHISDKEMIDKYDKIFSNAFIRD